MSVFVGFVDEFGVVQFVSDVAVDLKSGTVCAERWLKCEPHHDGAHKPGVRVRRVEVVYVSVDVHRVGVVSATLIPE